MVPSSHFQSDVQELSLTLGRGFSSLSEHQNHLEGSLIHRLLGATPRVSESIGHGGARESAFLASYPVKLMLLAHGPP